MKSLIASILILGLVGMVVGVAVLAQDTVTATVTPRLISVTVEPGLTDYGVMGTSESKVAAETFIVTNTGNDVEDILIAGDNSTDWTLASSPGNEIFAHKFVLGTTWPEDDTTGVVALSTTPGTFVNDLVDSETQNFRLKIYTPSATAATLEQSTTVTLTATYGG